MKLQGNLYALMLASVDETLNRRGAFGVTREEAERLNQEKYDIYCTPNGFDFGKRKKQDLKFINSFYADMDEGNLESMAARLRMFPEPSAIVRSGGGFHAYWFLKQEIACEGKPVEMADWFRSFTLSRIVPALRSDPGAADACRILRAPGFRYWKDGKGEHVVDLVHRGGPRYSLETLEKYFPPRYDGRIVEHVPHVPKDVKGSGFWAKANNLPVKESLERLSGSGHVSGERYTFKREKDTWRIFIDGVRRNAWIDREGKIGSMRGLGPSVPNWIFYHNRDWGKVAQILKTLFPEIGE